MYIKLAGKKSSAGEFACKLAREAYFGTDMMGKCTCNGSGDKPELPKAELLELKETVRQTFPKYIVHGHSRVRDRVVEMSDLAQSKLQKNPIIKLTCVHTFRQHATPSFF